jgi:hypothetical protein
MKTTLLLASFIIYSHINYAQQPVKVQAIETDNSFDTVSREKLQQAVRILDSIFNSETFAQKVQQTNFRVGNHKLNSAQILELIRSGADNYQNKPKDYSIDIRVAIFDQYYGHGNYGITNMQTRITSTHRCFILHNDLKCYVSHLAHEYMHQIGFTDDRAFPLGTKTNSVPYKIGDIVKDLIGHSQCIAQDQTCTKPL